jgi:pimeloyl-ACP methyl ester carboxylesterase
MFRELIPALERDFHLVAPDYPGFGNSDAPPREASPYTFERLSDDVEALLDDLGLRRFTLYVQDFGAPVGLRIAARHPERIEALIVQNGNAYEEGLTPLWDGFRKGLWKQRSPQIDAMIHPLFEAERIRGMYTAGVRSPEAVSPDTWNLDAAVAKDPARRDTQVDLLADYPSNLALYPAWQEYFRTHRPPTLIAWGKNDNFFSVEGARAFQRDLPDAQLHLLDTGHFALEEEAPTIAELVRGFHAGLGASRQSPSEMLR